MGSGGAVNDLSARPYRGRFPPGLVPRGAALVLALLVAGCASAGKRFDQGMDLERQDRYPEAAEHYIDALRKDADHRAARERLREVGPRAVSTYRDRALAARDQGAPVQAGEQYRAIDLLVEAAAAVGESWPPPAGYPAERREAFDGAIGRLMETAAVAGDGGDWPAAERALMRVDTFEPDRSRVREATAALVATYLEWSAAELARGRYRSALRRADQAYALVGDETRPQGRRALELQAAALEGGTIRVAITPLWRTDDAARFLPEDLVGALNDELELTAWTDPPQFVAMLDPLTVRRELRDLGYRRALITVPEAARLGRGLGAHVVVSGDVELFTITERDVTEELRKTTTRTGAAASYVRRSGKLDYRMRLEYLITDAATGHEVRRRHFEVTRSGRFERAVYDGDWTTLDLSRNEERWFDADRYRGYTAAIEDELVRRAARELGDRILGDLSRLIP